MEIYVTEEIPNECYFKSGDAEISKNKEYSNFLNTYCNAYHVRDISYRLLVTSIVRIFDGTIIDWCDKKQYGTSRNSSNAETRAICTWVLDQN